MPQWTLVDTHCHIDLYPSPKTVIAEAESNGIYTVAMTNAPSVSAHTFSLTEGCRFVQAAVGLHPQLVQSHGREIEKFGIFLKDTRFVGEIGLDYTTGDQNEKNLQRDVFARILQQCASCGGKILSVHSRRAATDVIAAIGGDYPGVVILHWFSGSARELERALDFGMYFSVNPSMVRSKKGQSLVAIMPRKRVLTESDGPFTRIEGRPARPSDVSEVVSWLSDSWKVSAEEVGGIISANMESLIGKFGDNDRSRGNNL